jgi:hypothetical protein
MEPVMTRMMTLAPAAALLGFALLAGCGHNMEQRAATGAATGLVVAGPVGAAVGAGVGAVVNEAQEPDGKN